MQVFHRRQEVRHGTADCCQADQGEQGHGEPVLVVHGIFHNGVGGLRAVRDLFTDRRLIAPSRFGYLGSSMPPNATPAAQADAFAALLDRLGIARAVLVVASSAGFTARRFASAQPGRVRGLVFLGSPALLSDKPGVAGIREWVEGLTDPLDPAELRGLLQSLVSRPLPEEFAELMVRESLRAPARVWRDTFRGLLEETLDGLERITAPALVVWGDRDTVLPRSDQERLTAALPRATLLVHEGSGHVVHWDDPARTAADLAAFAAARP